MSSAEEDYNDGENSSTILDSKKRRVQRACDMCRRKKIRCDGNQMPVNRCSNCVAYNLECTYVEAAKKRGPPKGYIDSLENRLQKMEKVLERICPDADFSHELGGGPIDRETWQKGNSDSSGSRHFLHASSSRGARHTPIDDLIPSDDDGVVALCLSENFKSMSLNPQNTRFFGKSSGTMLIQKAINLKNEATGAGDIRPEQHLHSLGETYYPWELATRKMKEPKYTFPDHDLGTSLVNLYFIHLNCIAPLLHRPSFERWVMQGEHLRNHSFGAVYLMVCAVASRFSHDPRVFLENVENANPEHSSGWKYFQQVQMVRRTLLVPPSLEDLQIYALCVMFLHGISAPQACWTMVGIGIRFAQDVGAHRRKSYAERPSVEGELWKRAFWVLVMLDRQMSSSLGRPCAIHDEDFDLDYPIECDDEYWELPDPEKAFKQPPDRPCALSFFISFLKLNNILSFALRTIYAINKSKVFLGFVGQQWEQGIVAEFDSTLNNWIDGVPDHLRWDPTRDPNSPFFLQSTVLYANYYVVQIFIHRPFIPSPRKPSPLSFPSLAICTNAARSCSHVIDIYRRRSGFACPYLLTPSFTAGIVLLLNIWGGKRSGLSMDPSKEMADVHKAMGVLKSCENRWHFAGKFWDILFELASVGELPLPQPSPQGGTKREREPDSPTESARRPSPQESTRAPAGTVRVSPEAPAQSQQPHQQPQPQPQHRQQPQQSYPPATYNLPLYSNDLGRLPLHGQAAFPASGPSSCVSTTSVSPQDHNPPEAWYPSLAGGTHQPAGPTHVAEHEFVPTEAYTMGEMFYDQLANPYGFAPPDVDPGTDIHSGPSTSPLNLQTLALGPSGLLSGETDTIAMWSTAPSGFGVSDWGTYLASVSGIVHPDGSSPDSAPHSHPESQHRHTQGR